MRREAEPAALRRTLAAAAVSLIFLIGLAAALSGPASQLVSVGSATARAQAADVRTFGGDPIWISLHGSLATTLDPADLQAEDSLEGQLRGLPGVLSVLGPGSYLSQTAVEIDRTVALEASAQGGSAAAQRKAVASLLVRYGYVGAPSLSNSSFVGQFVFGSGTSPVRSLSWLFPNASTALILVRPRAGLSSKSLFVLARRVRAVVAGAGLEGVDATVAGNGLVSAAATDSALRPVLLTLLALVLVSLILVSGASTPGASRLSPRAMRPMLPAACAGAAALILLAVLGRESGAAGLIAGPLAAALTVAGAVSAPAVVPGAAALVAGGLVLMATGSPLAAGIGLGVALSALISLLAVGAFTRFAGELGPIPTASVLADRSRGALNPLVPLALLAGLAAATVAALVLATGDPLDASVTSLSPSTPARQDLAAVQREGALGGQLRLYLTGRNLTSPTVLGWIGAVDRAVSAQAGGTRPGPDLATLLGSGAGPSLPSSLEVRNATRLIPQPLLRLVLSANGSHSEISLTLPDHSGATLSTLTQRIEHMVSQPPAGVRVVAAGSPAASAAAAHSLARIRPWLWLIVALVLMLTLRATGRPLRRAAAAALAGLGAVAVSSLLLRVASISVPLLAAALDPLILMTGGLAALADHGEARDAHAAALALLVAPAALLLAGVPAVVGTGAVVLAELCLGAGIGLLVPRCMRVAATARNPLGFSLSASAHVLGGTR